MRYKQESQLLVVEVCIFIDNNLHNLQKRADLYKKSSDSEFRQLTVVCNPHLLVWSLSRACSFIMVILCLCK